MIRKLLETLINKEIVIGVGEQEHRGILSLMTAPGNYDDFIVKLQFPKWVGPGSKVMEPNIVYIVPKQIRTITDLMLETK